MARDDRFYAFIIAHTPSSTASIRRFCVEKRSLKLLGFAAIILLCGSLYGFYGLTQQAAHCAPKPKINDYGRKTSDSGVELNTLNSSR